MDMRDWLPVPGARNSSLDLDVGSTRVQQPSNLFSTYTHQSSPPNTAERKRETISCAYSCSYTPIFQPVPCQQLPASLLSLLVERGFQAFAYKYSVRRSGIHRQN